MVIAAVVEPYGDAAPLEELARLGDVLRALRLALNYSQEGWGRELGVTYRTISRWESGASVPSQQALLHIKEVLKRPNLRFLLHRHARVEQLLVGLALVDQQMRQQVADAAQTGPAALEAMERPLPARGVCPRDGLAVAEHPRCAQCEVLAGPHHATPQLNAQGFCPTCARPRRN